MTSFGGRARAVLLYVAMTATALVVGTSAAMASHHAAHRPAAPPPPVASTVVAPPANQWRITDETSQLDNTRKYSAILISSNELSNSIGRPDHSALIVRCLQGALSVYVSWPDFLGTDDIDVKWKLDDGQITEESWDISSDGTATFAPSPAAFLGRLANAHKLVIQAPPYQSEPVEAVFNLDGVDAVAKTASEACSG